MQLSQEKNSYIGQQTVNRCFSAQTVAWADLYPFAVRTSVNRLLFACVRLLSDSFCWVSHMGFVRCISCETLNSHCKVH